MAPTYKIALIQFEPKPVDLEANFTHCAKAIREAAAAGAHLAVLPEYHLTSWVPEHPEFVAASAASAKYLARYQDLARETGVCIVPGTIVEAHATDKKTAGADGESPVTLVTAVDVGSGRADTLELRNMAYFIAGGSGQVLGRYQKTNLWHPERPHLTAPTQASATAAGSTVEWPPHAAFDTPWTWGAAAREGEDPGRPVRAGLLVCWDLAFPEAFRALVADGADLVVVPSFWNPVTDVDETALAYNRDCEVLFLRSALVSRAYENTCAVAFCNTGGVSQLALPLVGARGEILPGESRMSIAELDLDLLRVAESNYRVRADMAKEGWHYAHTLAVPGGSTRTAAAAAAAGPSDWQKTES